jgi:predicted dinucleotide-binding enzyme
MLAVRERGGRSRKLTKEHPMKIGIIGAENIGAALARKLAAREHEIKRPNSKEPDTIRGLPRDAGATAVSREDAAQGVSVIVLAIPFSDRPRQGA